MAGSGWLGLSVRGFGRRRPEPPDALVLSGGGSRASFQIGALTYLYDHTDFAPQTITGTSAGSILAAMLAQDSTHDGQRALLGRLDEIWRSLATQSDMFAERRWYRTLRGVAPEFEGILPTVVEDAPAVPEHPGRFPLPKLPSWTRRGPSRDELRARRTEPAESEEEPDQHFHPLLGFQPEEEDAGSQWRAGQVLQLLSALPGVGRASGELRTVARGAERTRSLYRPGPILRELLSPATFQPARVAASGVTLRIATVCLDTGQVRYLREDGVMVDRDDRPVEGLAPQDLVLGILASCSIPAVFAPVPLGDMHYVDGGVRENLPVEMAIGHLGAKRPYCIVSVPSGLAPRSGDENLASIVMRATAILSDEANRDEIAYARSAGAIVIEPEIAVHEGMTVDPGLIAINIDYGWMRAQEVEADADTEVQHRHRDIVVARTRAWALENDLADACLAAADRTDVVRDLQAQRDKVIRLVAQSPAGSLPPGAERWGRDAELHSSETAAGGLL